VDHAARDAPRPTPLDLDGVRALSFDCYGTLIDWEAGLAAELGPWARRQGLGVPDEELVAAFGALETDVERERPTAPYPVVLAAVLERLGERFGVVVGADDAQAFGSSVVRWPAFPDSHDALTRLATRFSLVVLSNVDHASFAASRRRLDVSFDLVITAQDVGSYKPDPRNVDALVAGVAELGVAPHELVHVAQSLYHDHQPARRAGLRTVWVDRRHDQQGWGATPPPTDPAVAPTWRVTSMRDLADALDV
jgi:2-haloalkanoic acid dehalogenase type II